MGVNVNDVAEFVGKYSDDDAPPGERLRGMAGNLNLDSVGEIREMRGRF